MEENKEIWSKFYTIRIIDGKPRKVIVDICGNIINNNPSHEELKQIKRHLDTESSEILKLQEEERKIYLLEFLRYFYYKEGRIPETRDFKNPKYPSYIIYYKVFGSWTDAIRDTGLIPNKYLNDEELLMYLIKFYEENGRSPTELDFNKNPKYPGNRVYMNRFGSWQKALKIIGLDINSMVIRGTIETADQKGRLGEIFVLDHFEEIGSIDLSGENMRSPCDGICPKGYNYDVKTAYFNGSYWLFNFNNINIDKIEWFYLLAFNKDFTKLLYGWGIPALDLREDIEKEFLYVYENKRHYRGLAKYSLENMIQYEITEKIKHVFEKWQNNLRKWTKEEILENARSKIKIYVGSKKCDIKNQFRELAEQGEQQIQRLEKGNSNFDKIEGMITK